MTIRATLNRKKRWVMILAILAVGGSGLGIVLVECNVFQMGNYIAALPGLLGFTLVMFWAQFFAFWCPNCAGNWGRLALEPPGWVSINSRVRYCPYCGVDIDGRGDPSQKLH